MAQITTHMSARDLVGQALASARIPALKPSLGILVAIENAFVGWQAKRLAEIPRERLHAQMLQDTRSFAEIRRSQR